MRTRIFFLLVIFAMVTNRSYGQSAYDTYVVGSSIDMKLNRTGFLKGVGVADDFYITAPITFGLMSKEKGYNIPLVHYNTARQPRKISTMEVSRLSSLNTIDAERFIAEKNKEQAIQWGKAHVNKTIWVIDRNDFYWSGGKQYMKLIETTITPETFPEPPKITYEYVD